MLCYEATQSELTFKDWIELYILECNSPIKVYDYPLSKFSTLLFSCTETLTDTMFGIYTSFVMHTHNMCFYLQSANWQNKLDRTVDRLQDNSEDVAQKLEVSF